MTALSMGSMCTGYGGLDMAVAAVLDVEPVWVADPDPGAAAILAHHHPGVPNLGDITAVDWSAVAPIDVLCGGYPCQPFSVAGRRKGTADARHLWPHIATALRVLRPRLAIFENVEHHLRLGFADVLADLAGLGFDAEWITLRASVVGAAHPRSRLIFLAWPADTDRTRLEGARLPRPTPQRGGVAAHPTHQRHQRPGDARGRRPGPADGGIAAAHALGDRRDQGRPEPARIGRGPDAVLGGVQAAADPHRDQRPRQRPQQPRPAAAAGRGQDADPIDWGDYGPAIDRWTRILGRPAPAPTEPGRHGRPRLSPLFVEWLMGLPPGHVTDPAIWTAYAENARKRGARITPATARNAQLRALGNGVVPQQGAAALASLLDRLTARPADGRGAA
ncbi:DNA cytosine methyltransferase [Actinomadura rudentiformis]|uniref:DNA (cytosine-5-)-methyltransferase n=2 Tax=Actinomadura rudentiformis TaxID=359158 RepID=A0A6H9YL79_9ACTN|nr:DNA cytosine methyltransferase [Actinomadura rudentiformis]